MADCERNSVAFSVSLYDFEGNLVCPAFCSFGAKLFIVNLLIKTDSTVICVPCTLEDVCYEPFSVKSCGFGKYPMLIG